MSSSRIPRPACNNGGSAYSSREEQGISYPGTQQIRVSSRVVNVDPPLSHATTGRSAVADICRAASPNGRMAPNGRHKIFKRGGGAAGRSSRRVAFSGVLYRPVKPDRGLARCIVGDFEGVAAPAGSTCPGNKGLAATAARLERRKSHRYLAELRLSCRGLMQTSPAGCTSNNWSWTVKVKLD